MASTELDFKAMQDEIRFFIAEMDTSRYTDDAIKRMINIANDEVIEEIGFQVEADGYIDTDGVKREFSLPADCDVDDVRLVEYKLDGTNYVYLEVVPIEKAYARREYKDSETGKPELAYLWGKKIGFVPIPSSSYAGSEYCHIKYWKRATWMDADGDKSDLPIKARTLVVLKAKIFAKEAEKDFDEAARLEIKYYEKLRLYKAKLRHRRYSGANQAPLRHQTD